MKTENSALCMLTHQELERDSDCTLVILQQAEPAFMSFSPVNDPASVSTLLQPTPALSVSGHWKPFSGFLSARYEPDGSFRLKDTLANRVQLRTLFRDLKTLGGLTRGAKWLVSADTWSLPDTPEVASFLDADTLAKLNAVPMTVIQKAWDRLTDPLIYGCVVVSARIPTPLQLGVLHQSTYDHLVELRYSLRDARLKKLLSRRENLLPVFKSLTKGKVPDSVLARGYEMKKAISDAFEMHDPDLAVLLGPMCNWLVAEALEDRLGAQYQTLFLRMVYDYAAWSSFLFLGRPLAPVHILPTSFTRAHAYAMFCARVDAESGRKTARKSRRSSSEAD